MADKLLVATMFVMLTVPGLGLAARLPLWLTVLVLSRDIAIVLTVAVVNLAVARRTFRPVVARQGRDGRLSRDRRRDRAVRELPGRVGRRWCTRVRLRSRSP